MSKRQRILNNKNKKTEEPLQSVVVNINEKKIEKPIIKKEVKPIVKKEIKKSNRQENTDDYNSIQTVYGYPYTELPNDFKKLTNPLRILEEIFNKSLTIEPMIFGSETVELFSKGTYNNFIDITNYQFTTLPAGTVILMNYPDNRFMAGFIVETVINPNRAKNNSINITYDGIENDNLNDNPVFVTTSKGYCYRFYDGITLDSIQNLIDLNTYLQATNLRGVDVHNIKKKCRLRSTITNVLTKDDLPKQIEGSVINSYTGRVNGYFFLAAVKGDDNETVTVDNGQIIISRVEVPLSMYITGNNNDVTFGVSGLMQAGDNEINLYSNSAAQSLLPKISLIFQKTFGDSYDKPIKETSEEYKIYALKSFYDQLNN